MKKIDEKTAGHVFPYDYGEAQNDEAYADCQGETGGEDVYLRSEFRHQPHRELREDEYRDDRSGKLDGEHEELARKDHDFRKQGGIE